MEKYLDILKRAWTITWRYKALWVLGLFAGTASSGSGGGSGGSSNYSSNSGSGSYGSDPFPGISGAQVETWLEQNLLAVAVVAAILVVIGIVFWVLSVAAQGGLVKGVNEAAEGRKPSLGGAWSFGFSKWGRTFMTSFVLGLPVLVIALVMVALVVAAGIGGALGGDAGGAAAIGGMCIVFPLLILVIITAALLIGVLYPIALRYGMLHDVTFGQSIKRAWTDLWAKRGIWVFWLVMLLPGIVFGFVTFLIMLPFLLPAVFLFIGEKFIIGGALIGLLVLVLMLPSAIYSTFVSAAWTVFFRRMTGMEPAYEVAVPAPAESAYPGGFSAPAPPAPPAAPVPPADLVPSAQPEVPVAPAAPFAPPAASDYSPPPPLAAEATADSQEPPGTSDGDA